MTTDSEATWGVLCALPEELGSLALRASHRSLHQGLEVLELELAGARVLACVAGIGKVRAAHAASVLVAAGARRALLVVGTCGGLRQALGPGTLVHCTIATQTDLAVRSGREIPSDPELRAAWREVAPGPEGWFLTADRPVLSLLRRLRLARAFAGPCVAEMETAAAAAVAAQAGVPWAALRAVTDLATLRSELASVAAKMGWAVQGPSLGGIASFRRHYPTCASLAADTVERLVTRLERGSVAPGRPPR